MQNKVIYNPNEIEPRWQKEWEEKRLFSPDMDEAKKPFYNLMMFPYPSAEGLHVGNMYAFTGADVYARFMRMKGYDVFEPIGLDGFGIHSENYAMKVGRHPKAQAEHAEKNFYRQLRSIGNSFDWQRTVETYDPAYYRWTQWLFIQMFKNGLAYRKKATVNFCPSCKTVLADEQVIAGECERCGTVVEKRALEQWFFRITEYTERLLKNIDELDWSEKVKIAQRNWIGKSEGARVAFTIENTDIKLEVFTTRPDTLYGATFMVIAPEHSLIEQILNGEIETSGSVEEVRNYVEQAMKKSEIDRTAEGKEKTGVFTGVYALNPISNKKIPVWVADYVLVGYGTGAIMAVPAHDERDHEFAKKYNLEIVQIIKPDNDDRDVQQEAYTGGGVIINSGTWDGIHVPEQINEVIRDIEKDEVGRGESQYHLRDWLISRQRYWGPPIPMIFCERCAERGQSWFTTEEAGQSPILYQSDFILENSVGWYPVPEENLPVQLPDVEDWRPQGDGVAPLANHKEFYETTCPGCSSPARRETDVSDTFLDSAWYFFRYTSTDIDSASFDVDRVKKWLPVDIYIGGAEHAVLHLLYSRFVTSFLSDLKFIDFDEPFKRMFAHGLIIREGAKMSKSKGNVIVPDEYIAKYGADTLRSYLMFLGQFSQGGDFYDTGIEGMHRFIKRVWNLYHGKIGIVEDEESRDTLSMLHKTIRDVSKDLEELSYNTAIARMMEFYNYISEQKSMTKDTALAYLKLMAPFAPHMTEQIYQELQGGEYESVHLSSWPQFDEKYLVSDTVLVVIQVNGKKRGEVTISRSESESQSVVEDLARKQIPQYLDGIDVKKVIYVPGRIISFVI